MTGAIWVLAEHWKGELTDATFELLTLGRELADGLGVALEAVLAGHEVRPLAAHLGAADRVLCLQHPGLAEPNAEVSAHAVAALFRARQPRAVLVPLTNTTWDLGGLFASQLSVPFVNSCCGVRVVDGALQGTCLLYGGKMQATTATAEGPAIFGILPGTRQAEKGRVAKTPEVEEMAAEVIPGRVRFNQYIQPEAGDVDITQQNVLVAVGRGLQTQENVALAEELARALGGAVCGSRPVIDQGWLTLSRQVGKSGATVKPKLYLAAGISGAPEHVEGMKDAELIIAINTDAQAPIFNVAHFGVLGDALDVLTALTEQVRGAAARKVGG